MGQHGTKLTAAFVRSVQKPGLYWYEHGLVFRVKPSGYKQWIQRLFIHGKRRELGLGPVRLVLASLRFRRGRGGSGADPGLSAVDGSIHVKTVPSGAGPGRHGG